MNSILVVDLKTIYGDFYGKYKKKIDHEKLINFAKEKYGNITNIVAFGVKMSSATNFIKMMRHLGVNVHLVVGDHSIPMTVALMKTEASRLIVATNDTRYIPALETLASRGVYIIQLTTNPKGFSVCQEYATLTEALAYEQQLELPS